MSKKPRVASRAGRSVVNSPPFPILSPEAGTDCGQRIPSHDVVEGGSSAKLRRRRLADDTAMDVTRKKIRVHSLVAHSPSPQHPQPASQAKKPLLACPFHKRDPEIYHDCYKYELSRVKDVRQHLRRKHSRPVYCARCYKVFGSAESLENHARSAQPCELRNGPPELISEQQWEKVMEQYLSRGKPVEEQWMVIWDVLFPGAQRPLSPYLESHVGDVLARLRAFWAKNRFDITAKITGTTIRGGRPEKTVVIFDRLVKCLIDGFGARTIGPEWSCLDGTPRGVTWGDAGSISSGTLETSKDDCDVFPDWSPCSESLAQETALYSLTGPGPGPLSSPQFGDDVANLADPSWINMSDSASSWTMEKPVLWTFPPFGGVPPGDNEGEEVYQRK